MNGFAKMPARDGRTRREILATAALAPVAMVVAPSSAAADTRDRVFMELLSDWDRLRAVIQQTRFNDDAATDQGMEQLYDTQRTLLGMQVHSVAAIEGKLRVLAYEMQQAMGHYPAGAVVVNGMRQLQADFRRMANDTV